jgi:two-component system invasion response regulator UvrY
MDSSHIPPNESEAKGFNQTLPIPAEMHILIVDDHTIVRDGMKQILGDAFPTAKFGEAGDFRVALDQLEKAQWDVVLLDISLPGQSGLDLLKQIRNIQPKASVLVLTMHPESQYAMRALKAGAGGYMTKETAAAEVVAAVRKVRAGGKYISAKLAEKLVSYLEHPPEKAPHEQLSDREFQVFKMIAMGKTVKEIGFDLSLSIKTVSTYRTRVMKKMNFKSNADVTRYALEEKLIQ